MTLLENCIFISYSHKDKRWLENLQTHLVPFVENGSFVAWDDTRIPLGERWHESIQDTLNRCNIVLFLVSPNFLASSYIKEHERDPIFLKSQMTHHIRMIPVLVKACAFQETYLEQIQFFVPDGGLKPLADLPPHKRDHAFVKLCNEIKRTIA
jgi:internalin A